MFLLVKTSNVTLNTSDCRSRNLSQIQNSFLFQYNKIMTDPCISFKNNEINIIMLFIGFLTTSFNKGELARILTNIFSSFVKIFIPFFIIDYNIFIFLLYHTYHIYQGVHICKCLLVFYSNNISGGLYLVLDISFSLH